MYPDFYKRGATEIRPNSCANARYGNLGCQLSKGGIQNKLDIWLKINIHLTNMPNKIKKNQMVFDRKNWLWKLVFGPFWQLSTTYWQNTIIFSKFDDFWPKTYLILYPSLWNLTTQIAIMPGSKADLRKLVCTTMMKTVRSNPFKMKLPHPCFSAKTSTTFQRWNDFLSTSLSNWVDIVPKIYKYLVRDIEPPNN